VEELIGNPKVLNITPSPCIEQYVLDIGVVVRVQNKSWTFFFDSEK